MSSPKGHRQTVVARAAIALLCCLTILLPGPGCAVMTVDVDVYKGPLMNHRKVQAEQATNLALAAQPLLARLRYELEFYQRARSGPPLSRAEQQLIRYSQDFIPQPSPAEPAPDQYRFRSREAHFVNGVLALYDDDTERSEANQLISKVKDAVSDADARTMGLSSPVRTAKRDQAVQEVFQGIALELVDTQKLHARGRRALGLNTLFDIYLALRNNHPGDADTSGARTHLFEALLEFSQRMTFVVNHESFFQEAKGPLQETGAVLRYVVSGESGKHVPADAYVRVLQAIGNSVQVQINELLEQEEHDLHLADGKGREAAAVEAIWRPSATRILHRLTESIRAERDRLEPELRKLADAKSEAEKKHNTVKEERNKLAELRDDKKKEYQKLDEAAKELSKTVEGLAAIETVLKAEGDYAPFAAARDKFLDDKTPQALPPNDVALGVKNLLESMRQTAAAALAGAGTDADKKKHAIQVEQLTLARDYFREKEKGAGASRPRREVYDEIVAALRSALADRRKDLAGSAKPLEDAKKALDETEAKVKDADPRVEEAEKLARNAAAEHDQKQKAFQKQQDALDAIAELGPRVAWPDRQAAGSGVKVAETTIQRLLAEISAERLKAEGAKDANRVRVMANAADVVSAKPPPPGEMPDVNPNQSSKEVLDQVIAVLRHEHAEALRSNGEQSAAARNIESALAAAYAQRSGMVYIRPAAAYLRTSFPATTLQRDARIGWSNMLADHYRRQLPFASSFLNDAPDLRRVLELDKQYWQNVNTIRVAGGGNTNYVVVKDDVGNWYVKNFSTNPEPIIRSAMGVAMFSLGPAMAGANLLGAAAQQQAAARVASGKQNAVDAAREVRAATRAGSAAAGTAAPAAPVGTANAASTTEAARATTVRGQQFNLASDRYDEQTAADLAKAKEDAAALKDAVLAVWSQGDELKDYRAKLDPLLNDPATTHLKPVNNPPAANTPRRNDAEELVDALQKMRRFHNAVLAAIRPALTEGLPDAVKKAEEAKTKADKEVEEGKTKVTQAQADRDRARTKLDEATRELDSRTLAAAQAEKARAASPNDAVLTELAAQAARAQRSATDQRDTAQTALNKAESDLKAAQDAEPQKKKDAEARSEDLKKARDTQDAAIKAAAAAAKKLTATVRPRVVDMIKKREQLINDYGVAMDVIEK